MHLPGSTCSKISLLFCGRFHIASIGQYRGNADGIAFIFAFDAEMVAAMFTSVGLGPVFMQ
jgi:hypothetical protein